MPRPPENFQARLVAARPLSPRVRLLAFERVDGPFDFEAGQWVSLWLPLLDAAGKPVRRSYSIASAPRPGSPGFELAVTQVDGGPGSTFLHALAPGAEVEVRGPQGTFTFGSGDAPALMIATGSGLAPLRSMLHAEVARGRRAPLRVLFGARTEADVLWQDELDALARTHAWLRVVVTLSQPQGAWPGATGYVQRHVVELFRQLETTGGAPAHAYVCGLKKMLLEVRGALKAEGVERQRLHAESYD